MCILPLQHMQHPRLTFATFKWKHLKHKSEIPETLETWVWNTWNTWNTASLVAMAYLVGDCSSHQALENEDGERNRKSWHVSSHHHRDVEPEAAPTTRDQEKGHGGWAAVARWQDGTPPHPHEGLVGESAASSRVLLGSGLRVARRATMPGRGRDGP
jgi:hypothetical protein